MAKEEDTVALLCAAARKWAKWDRRFVVIRNAASYRQSDYLRILDKREKWMQRTLSYGHHLLSAGASKKPADDVWSLEEMEALRAKNAKPLEFNRICIDPAAEVKRLDTLVQQLCARVAVLEDGSADVHP